ncbi:hypothetical protein EVAR_29484_1 [Eumeta japonica]|uniref:Uncharacterized protein n=1 Tax=Eumeta variegata TaxID=151549 RepID=A0A4C1WSQ8_EUMVA|nr:hypothetical protein EVAR_29484_1 [Eumeta japonica]
MRCDKKAECTGVGSENRRIAYMELSENWVLGSNDTNIFRDHLFFRKRYSRSAPHRLTDERKDRSIHWRRFVIQKFNSGFITTQLKNSYLQSLQLESENLEPRVLRVGRVLSEAQSNELEMNRIRPDIVPKAMNPGTEEKKSMKFAVPRIWREPTDHIHDCYFCVVNPIPHSEISCAFEPKAEGTGQLPLSQISSNSGDSEFVITSPSVEPHLINSEEFDDLVRDLNLPKLKAEILGSRLKQWNLLKNDVIISDQRKRHKTFSGFFTKEDGLCYCNDVKGLFEAIGIPCISSEWRLFIDSSTRSLKAVLLHNGNKFPSLPLLIL